MLKVSDKYCASCGRLASVKLVSLALGMTFITACSNSEVYNIKDFGAVNDTTKLSTEAIQMAIDRCSEAGGGTVLVPAGAYKIGSIVLKSNVCIEMENGSILYGSTDLKDYVSQKTDYVSFRTHTPTIQLIYADKVKNVTIRGNGIIDGQGRGFKKLATTDEGITRPHLLRFIQSEDICVKDITLRNSGCWMQHYLACDRVQISGIKVFNRNNYNNDALDIDGCHDVTVSGMISDSDDDGITLKSTSPRMCENVNITGCVVSSHCNGIKLGTETNGGFRNIAISNCVVKPSADQSSRFYGNEIGTSAISLEMVDGGTLENVSVSNIVVEGTESPIFVRLANRARSYSPDVEINNVGILRRVHIDNILVNNAGNIGSSITGVPGYRVEDVVVSNVSITHRGGCDKVAIPADEKIAEYPEATMWGPLPAQGFFIRHAKGVRLENIRVKALSSDKRPLFVTEDVVDCVVPLG